MAYITLGEVFQAAAGAFLGANNDSQMASAIFVIVEIHSLKGPAFTNGFGFGYSQFVIQSINPQ